MTRRRASAKSDPPGLLERLSPEESLAVLRQLLEQHPELSAEAEQLANQYVSSISIEDIAQDVYDRFTSIDLDELNGRAGKHSWGYVEPGEAAVELMEESIQDVVDDMKRKAQLGLFRRPRQSAPASCKGCISCETLGWTAPWAGRQTFPRSMRTTWWETILKPALRRFESRLRKPS